MNDLTQFFFYFVRKGLWGSAEIESSEPDLTAADWEQLYLMAYSQAVTGILIDGVSCTAMRPPTEIWEQWLLHLLKLEMVNRQVRTCGHRWLERLANEGVSAFVFKGSSVAEWYKEPLHRSFGDVDIVVRSGWDRIESLLLRDKVTYRNDHGDWVVLTEGQPPVEFHPNWEYVYNPFINARLQKICSKSDGSDKELYLVCLILHLRRHFLTYGVGLKQVCDVAVMWQNGGLDMERLSGMLRLFHIEKFTRILFGFIRCYLGGGHGFPLMLITEGRDYKLFCNVILNEGYILKFEQTEIASGSHSGVVRILKNCFFWLRRSLRLFHLMPGEAVGFLLYMTGRRLKSLWI